MAHVGADELRLSALGAELLSKFLAGLPVEKLIFAGISLEVCAAFPAITAVGEGLDAYVAVDASGTFSGTKRQSRADLRERLHEDGGSRSGGLLSLFLCPTLSP